MSKLDLLIEAERRGILPDDKKELLAEARKRGLVPGGGPEPEVGDADRALRRTVNTATFGLGNYPLDAAAAAGKVVTGNAPEFSSEFQRQRAMTRKALENESLNAPDIAADTIGNTVGAAATLPFTVSKGVGQGLKIGADYLTREMTKKEIKRQIAGESTRVGAAFGAASGYGHSADNASIGEQLANLGEGAFGGAVIGRAIPPILEYGGNAINWARNKIARPSTAAAERANAIAEDFAATGTPEFAPALGGPVTEGTASGLAGTVLGGPIRAKARTSLDALEARIQQEIEARGGGGTPTQVGGRAQDFIDRQVNKRSRTPEEIQAMNPLELHGISGVPPTGEVPPPRVAPVQPRQINPVTRDQVLQEAEANAPVIPPKPVTDLESRYIQPTKEEIELAPEMVKKVQDSSKAVADLDRRLQAEKGVDAKVKEGLLGELRDAGLHETHPIGNTIHFTRPNGTIAFRVDSEGNILGNAQLTPQERAAAVKVHDWYVNHGPDTAKSIADVEKKLQQAKHEREIVQREMEAFRIQELPKLAEQRRAEALADATKANEAEASVATQKARQGAREKADADAVAEAVRRTEAARAEEAARADRATAVAQQAANEAHAAQMEAARNDLGNSIPVLGRTREHTYQTEIDAAYAANRENMPDMRRNVLGRKETNARPAEQTNTSELLDTFGLEARRQGKAPGYKEGDVLSGDVIHPDVMAHLRERLGPELADRLAYYAERRASGQFAPGVQGLQDLRTAIDREIAKVRRPPPAGMGQHREDYGMLARLRQAVDRDISEFAQQAGPEGAVYRRQREQIDHANRQLEQQLRPALKGVFGEKVNPAEALAELVSATQQSTKSDVLQAFFRVAREKGNPSTATSWLLNGMTRDGLPGFLKAYRAISPEARQMMAEADPALMGFLDRAARVGGKLERFTKTAREEGLTLGTATRPSNLAIGSIAYLFGVPGVVAEAVGGAAASKLLSSNWYAGWLKSFPVVRNPAAPEVARHFNQLYNYASQSLGLDKGSAQSLKDALVPSKAKAAPFPAQPAKKDTYTTGSGWADNLPRFGEARNEADWPDSPWMPVRPDMQSEDANSFKPFTPNEKDRRGIERYPSPYPTPSLGDRGFRQKTGGPVPDMRPFNEVPPLNSGSEWTDNLKRLKGARGEEDLPDSPWLPVNPDLKQRQRSLNPEEEDVNSPHYLPPPLKAKPIVFGGQNSQTADKAALAKAKEMDGNAKPEEIWKRTGWYKGKDDEWRNEIDDSKAKFKITPEIVAGRKPTDYLETTLGKVIDHPDLFAAYPELSSLPVRLFNTVGELPNQGGGASTSMPSKSNPRGYIELPVGSTDPDDLDLVLHEVAHALEPKEGFDYGPWKGKYRDRQGEVIARNVQNRSQMTAKERRNSYPPSTEDVKWPKVLVRPKGKRPVEVDEEEDQIAAHAP